MFPRVYGSDSRGLLVKGSCIYGSNLPSLAKFYFDVLFLDVVVSEPTRHGPRDQSLGDPDEGYRHDCFPVRAGYSFCEVPSRST